MSLSTKFSDWVVLLCFLPSWWAPSQHSLCRGTAKSSQTVEEAYSTMKCVKQNGPGEWQRGTELTANKAISEIFHAFCSVGGEVRWLREGTGGKRGEESEKENEKERGGVSKAERVGCESRWRWIVKFSFFPSCWFLHWEEVPGCNKVVQDPKKSVSLKKIFQKAAGTALKSISLRSRTALLILLLEELVTPVCFHNKLNR